MVRDRSLLDHDQFDGLESVRSLQSGEVDSAGEVGAIEGDAILTRIHHMVGEGLDKTASDVVDVKFDALCRRNRELDIGGWIERVGERGK